MSTTQRERDDWCVTCGADLETAVERESGVCNDCTETGDQDHVTDQSVREQLDDLADQMEEIPWHRVEDVETNNVAAFAQRRRNVNVHDGRGE